MSNVLNTNCCSKLSILLLKFLSWIIVIFLAFKLLLMICNITNISIMYNVTNEFFDFPSYRLTHLIMQFNNPYKLEGMTRTTVPFLDLYTGLNPLISAVVCSITGISVSAGYYVTNLLWVFLTAFNIWLVVKDFFGIDKPVAFLCVIINVATFFAYFGLPVFNLHADSIGIYVSSLIILEIYKNKENTILISALTVLLIFTKQILIIFSVPIFIFYLVKDKKSAVNYVIQCVLIGGGCLRAYSNFISALLD